MKLIAETAWHHQGDFSFMKNLILQIVNKTNADVIKMHITLDLDEYMDSEHELYKKLQSMLFNEKQWSELINIVRKANREIMLLVNDTQAVEFASFFNSEYIEVHSTCLNDIFILKKLKSIIQDKTKIVLGVGGTNIDEIENAINILKHSNFLLMFGFQNYPTLYKDINLNKIRKLMRLFEGFDFGYADHTAINSHDNELITLLGAASGMKYVEKHVTTNFGEQRLDSSAAISLEMFNNLHNKIKILDELNGNGSLLMNSGEQAYSIFGPMKKAAVCNCDVSEGSILKIDLIKFTRTKDTSDMSQLDILNFIGKKIIKSIKKGTILKREHFNI